MSRSITTYTALPSPSSNKVGIFDTIAGSTENDSAHTLTITGPVSANCMLKIEPRDAVSKGTTQGLFTIISPDGGDINNDGNVDLTDAIVALQVLARINPAGTRPNCASSGTDVSRDNKIGMEEVVYILQSIAELRE